METRLSSAGSFHGLKNGDKSRHSRMSTVCPFCSAAKVKIKLVESVNRFNEVDKYRILFLYLMRAGLVRPGRCVVHSNDSIPRNSAPFP
jgi:hypothetical protein